VYASVCVCVYVCVCVRACVCVQGCVANFRVDACTQKNLDARTWVNSHVADVRAGKAHKLVLVAWVSHHFLRGQRTEDESEAEQESGTLIRPGLRAVE